MKEIKQALRIGEFVEVRYSDNTTERVQEVRGGLMFPTAQSPGFFCVLGQLPEKNSNFKHPLILLAEVEADLPQHLYKKLSEEARKMLCWTFYYDYNESNYGFHVSLSKYLRKRDLSRISMSSPYIGDWLNGIFAIRERSEDGTLKIPKDSIIGRQLGKMTPDDQRETERSKSYAVDALRCVLGSFELPSRRRAASTESIDYYFG